MRAFLAPSADRSIEPGSIPTFSVVIPAYEAARFIGRAVESALAQTVPAVEIIVADDGSTDDLTGALQPYRDRVQLVRGEHGGASTARNRGFRAASGDFVVNLDADDVIHPHWLESVRELASVRPDLDVLTTDSYITYDGRRLRHFYSDPWLFCVKDQRLRIFERNFIAPAAAVRRRRFLEIGGFDESLLAVVDWDFWARLILDGSQAGCVDEPLAEYTVREGSISTRRIDVLRGCVRLLEKSDASAALEPSERNVLLRCIAERRRDLARLEIREALVRGDPGARRRALAVALEPEHPALTRLKLAASALAPGVARRVLQRRDERAWVGAGGTRVKRRQGART